MSVMSRVKSGNWSNGCRRKAPGFNFEMETISLPHDRLGEASLSFGDFQDSLQNLFLLSSSLISLRGLSMDNPRSYENVLVEK